MVNGDPISMMNLGPMQVGANYMDVIYSLFNGRNFSIAKLNMDSIKYYFNNSYLTKDNKVIKTLLNIIETQPFNSITGAYLYTTFSQMGKSDVEARELSSRIICSMNEPPEKYENMEDGIEKIVASSILMKGSRTCSNPMDLLKFLKKSNYVSKDSMDYFNTKSIDQIDFEEVLNDVKEENCIGSGYSWIDEAFSEKGIKRGDIVVVSMSPSSGKSLFAEYMAIYMSSHEKKNVHMLVMGDLDDSSLTLRLCAIYSGWSFKKLVSNPELFRRVFNSLVEDCGGRLDYIICPAGQVSASEYVDYVLNKSDKRYDVVIADYDSNFKSNLLDEGGNSNMYLEYGNIYNEFTKLKYKKITSIILSQPKQFAWNNPRIMLNDLGESSRKAHIADVVITRGRESECPNGLGIFRIAKNRHGASDYDIPTVRLSCGRFFKIPKVLYDELKKERERIDYTEDELLKYSEELLRSVNGVNYSVNMEMMRQKNSYNNNDSRVATGVISSRLGSCTQAETYSRPSPVKSYSNSNSKVGKPDKNEDFMKGFENKFQK